jgi:hypothetical protein
LILAAGSIDDQNSSEFNRLVFESMRTPPVLVAPPRTPFLAVLFFCAASYLAPGTLAQNDNDPTEVVKEIDARQLAFFESKIRPVLIEYCYECHSNNGEEAHGGLWLDSRQGLLKGGDHGPAIQSRDPRTSLLIQVLSHEDELAMPPDEKLDDEVIQNFRRWVLMGAPDPRNGELPQNLKPEMDIEAGREFWAFKPPYRQEPQPYREDPWSRTEIDRYLFAEMQKHNLEPVKDANANTLLRRIYFDLIGLPPDPVAISQFEVAYQADPQSAVGSIVDQLLANQGFGERWGRHWLDIARYAESSGGPSNQSFPHAWRYRDYVIDAFNNDKPFDQFILEQIAGDLIDAANENDRAENIIATGFLAIGVKQLNQRDRRQFRADLADEQLDATFQVFQALTVACARCHDHKFDPISQEDYYAVAGIFRNTDTCYGTLSVVQSLQPSELIELPAGSDSPTVLEPLSSAKRTRIQQEISRLQRRRDNLGEDVPPFRRLLINSQITEQQSELSSYDPKGQPLAFAMGVKDRRFVSDAPLLIRGEIDQPGEVIPRGLPQVLLLNQPKIPRRSSGRLELAQWMASKENPLTGRVMANRIWLHLMGRGLVATPDNFGAAGLSPSHPALLDYLALRFVEQGWSVKTLIREIMMSRAYQLSSGPNENNDAVDPDNQWHWRMPTRRLEAEAIRDTMLFLSGRLTETPEKGSPVAAMGEGPINRLIPNTETLVSDSRDRSIYLPILRNQLPESLTLFDFPDPSLIVGERARTSIPSQALYMLNNPFVLQQSTAFAGRLLSTPGNETQRIQLAYQLCLSRLPNNRELSKSQAFVEQFGREHSTLATWTAFSQALFSTTEFSNH